MSDENTEVQVDIIPPGDELALGDERRKPPPKAWSGGEHSGERLSAAERKIILDLMAEGESDSEIRRRTGHSRNTIASIAASPERAAWLKETRQVRMLAQEDSLMRERTALIEDLEERGKLKLSDLNSAAMITGIAIKDSGGSAPVRVEVNVEHEFKMAAELMTAGGFSNAAASFAPPPPAMEAEVVPVEVKKSE